MEKYYSIGIGEKGEKEEMLILEVNDLELEVIYQTFGPKRTTVREIKKEDITNVIGEYRPAWRIFKHLDEQSCIYQP